MKIAIIADVLGEENNGTTITVTRLIANLKKRGHEVRVVSPGKGDEEGYYAVGKRDFKIFNEYFEKNGISLAKPNEKILRECIGKSDVVHILMPFSLGKAAIKLCAELHKPVTTAFHVQPENVSSHFGLLRSRRVNSYLYTYFLNGFYRYCEYIHCPTAFIAGQLRAHGYTHDLRIISNGVDPAFTPARGKKPPAYADKFCILTTGRLVKEKCQEDLIRAVGKSKYADRILLFIAGEGPLEGRLRRLGEKLPNPPVIGFHPKEELVRIINFCDLYVHPSYAEIESIACVEAITCGLVPVISDSKMSAARHFALSERNLCPAGDVKEMARRAPSTLWSKTPPSAPASGRNTSATPSASRSTSASIRWKKCSPTPPPASTANRKYKPNKQNGGPKSSAFCFLFKMNAHMESRMACSSAKVWAKRSAPAARSCACVLYPHSTLTPRMPAFFAVCTSVSPSPTKAASAGSTPSSSKTMRVPVGSGLTGTPSRLPKMTEKPYGLSSVCPSSSAARWLLLVTTASLMPAARSAAMHSASPRKGLVRSFLQRKWTGQYTSL